ncbi:hypothetical protein [Ktedonobacter racemifer]|uniref:hypothetical protein n=1 Tax=Ktedonobacter racemifer TaxID=363277 RepID=UPI00146EF327|nr:hypothetical protein [Ktedonobacter racemifer]
MSDGTLSIWTVAGRKHLTYSIPQDFKTAFEKALEIDSLTVIKRDGKLIGRVTLTLDAPEPQGILPVGIDLNETNALVAVDPDGQHPLCEWERHQSQKPTYRQDPHSSPAQTRDP